jgi:peptidoglycan/xylan/chitin deacetylase (PgdA/CDA1 family)
MRATPAPTPEVLSELFESDDFIVVFAKAGDTSESLATRFLGDAAKSWMIEEYNGASRFSPGQEVVVPKRPWNPSGVEPSGFQLIPIFVYHNIGPQAKGRLVIAAKAFEEQMRYLKSQGYRVVSLREFYKFISLERQLPRKTVVLTFDDGYQAFLEYAYPLLKELGFTATLFVYTDYVGAGRNALNWDDLKKLDAAGFEVEAHSKSHSDLRRNPDESERDYARRMQAELEQPLSLFKRHLGRASQILAYPYGAHDDELVEKVREAGYVAAFSVRRQGNPSFVHPIKINRSQIYSEMSLSEFIKNLNVFSHEAIQ